MINYSINCSTFYFDKQSISIYDSIFFFAYQEQWKPEKNVKRGTKWIQYGDYKEKKSWWSLW